MLRNQIYIGKIIWNTNSSIKNPETGRRLYRRAPVEDRIVVDAPHLRIIEQDLWDRVEAIHTQRSKAKGLARAAPAQVRQQGSITSWPFDLRQVQWPDDHRPEQRRRLAPRDMLSRAP
jgi:hypothetical protein